MADACCSFVLGTIWPGCDHNQLMIVCLVAGLVRVGCSRSTVFNH